LCRYVSNADRQYACSQNVQTGVSDMGLYVYEHDDHSSLACNHSSTCLSLQINPHRSVTSTRLRTTAAFLEALEKNKDQWESSTRAGDDAAHTGQLKKGAAAAEEFLLENPELRAVHSTASVKSLMDRSAVEPPGVQAS